MSKQLNGYCNLHNRNTKKQTAVQWLQSQFDNCPESFLTDDDFAKALQMEREQMIGFAHYLRNGLTNIEYCQKEHEEHLEYWRQNYR
jgi:hypothetical protein